MALKGLDLGAWIDRPGDVDCKHQKWVGAPAPTCSDFDTLPQSVVVGRRLLLSNCWGTNPCYRNHPDMLSYNRRAIWILPIGWFMVWLLLHSGLVWQTWCFREEFVKGPRRVQPLTAVTAAAAAAANTATPPPPPRRTVVREVPQPQTFWPTALRVESVSPSAPVPPAFICPITMAPMANPAITPRGTSYDREALSDWISNEHRYPGGEARATRKPTHSQCPG